VHNWFRLWYHNPPLFAAPLPLPCAIPVAFWGVLCGRKESCVVGQFT
jgi:hypothetical protein